MNSRLHLLLSLFYCLILNILSAQNAELPTDSSAITKLYNRIESVHQEVINNPNKQVSNFSSVDSATLPIGIVKEIGNTIYAICIDSAFFTPNGAYFHVYMAMDFPGSDRKLAFAAKNVQFNPQGVIVSQGSKLQLVSEQTIALGPKLKMLLKNDGKNFIEWDCNGYKQAGISADFIIDPSILVNALNETSPVKASMEIVVADLNNIVFNLPSMTPFYVRGAKDFVFNLQNIVIDRSEFQTPTNVHLTSENLMACNGDRNSWKGFYAQQATVTLPEKLSKHNQPTQIFAYNLLIDDSGLSGSFGANNVFSTSEGSMNDSWGFSIESIQVSLSCNNLISAGIGGTITVPVLDDKNFIYQANIHKNSMTGNLDYTFILSIDELSIPLTSFKSTLKLYHTSSIIVQSVDNKFIPKAVLSGNWMVDFTKAKIKGVRFQNLTITTQAPYITDGIFSLDSDTLGSKCINFNISLAEIGIRKNSQNNLLFFAGFGMSLGNNEGNSFGVNTSAMVITSLQTDHNGKMRLVYDRFAINDIAINCKTSAIELAGVISLRNDDPIFGDLFFGSISLKIKGVIDNPLMVSVGFGKFPAYKYWFTDVSLPVSIPIFAGLKISSIYGGVQNRVQSTLTTYQLLDRVSGKITTSPTSSGSAIPFVPNENMGLTFRVGVGLQAEVEKVFNGDVLLSVAFNSNGGFQSIDLAGQAFMMVNREERKSTTASKAWGEIMMSYDNSQKVLDAQFSAAIIVPEILNGGLSIKLHIDPDDWYFWLNRPSQRAWVNLVDVFTAKTYFMIGTQIEAIPPPPSYVANIVGYNGNTPDMQALGNGGGFCTGLDIGVNFQGEFPKSTDWRGFVQFQIGAGFDVMIFNSENTRCEGSSKPIGVNGYYSVGQVYAYLGGALGVKKYKDGKLKRTYNVGSLQVAALLQGKLPKPSYVYGAVGIQCEILNIINFSFTADVEFGDNCNFVSL